MDTQFLNTLVKAQASITAVIQEYVTAISPCSDEGPRISDDELMRIKMRLLNAKERFDDVIDILYKERVLEKYNETLISDIAECPICEMVDDKTTVNDIVSNPIFPIAVFSIKSLLETIDDKIAEQDHQGIRGCLTGISNELNNFPELHEIVHALNEVRDTFTDITMVSDMMYDFEKFYNSVFLLHDPLNVGIALGSIKSVLPPPEVSDIEFF